MPHFEVRPAEKAQLLEQGCALNLSTMARQGRYDAEFGEPRRWQRFVEAAFAGAAPRGIWCHPTSSGMRLIKSP